MPDTPTITVELYQAKAARFLRRPQRWRWRAKAANGRILAHSGEAYVNLQDCLDAIARLFSRSTNDVYLRQDGQPDRLLRGAEASS